MDVYKLDLSSLKSVRECAKQIKLKEDKVHFLVNNAGVAVNAFQEFTAKQTELKRIRHFLVMPSLDHRGWI